MTCGNATLILQPLWRGHSIKYFSCLSLYEHSSHAYKFIWGYRIDQDQKHEIHTFTSRALNCLTKCHKSLYLTEEWLKLHFATRSTLKLAEILPKTPRATYPIRSSKSSDLKCYHATQSFGCSFYLNKSTSPRFKHFLTCHQSYVKVILISITSGSV